jgi:tyrosine decarboxylase / aspartate 1-decarboxylase
LHPAGQSEKSEAEKYMQLDQQTLSLLLKVTKELDAGFTNLPEHDAKIPGADRLPEILQATAVRLRDNYPYFHPLYAGQMLKPPHPVARLAYALAMFINPNNHALDGGRATSAMEKEAVAEIAAMFRWEKFLGHLCCGGTMANLEALWIAGQLHPGKKILASDQAHYTHSRISQVLKLDFECIPTDSQARVDVAALKNRLAVGDVGTVVATMGTTATGSVDPLDEILALTQQHNVRVHADAAYGGYFTLASNLAEPAARAFAKIGEADSIVIDPHKHGLQPYGCGCVLFRDPSIGRLYKHNSPYTYFTSADLHLGEISLECSRPGAAAAALWATQRLLPLEPKGEFAEGLKRSRQAAMNLYAKLKVSKNFLTAFEPGLDIVIFAPKAATLVEISTRSRRIFEAAAKRDLHLALAELPTRFFAPNLEPAIPQDDSTITVLRSVLMKPEHLDWTDQIWQILESVS